jgi:hypothetical protein
MIQYVNYVLDWPLSGVLLCCPGSGNISPSWLVDEESDWGDSKTRLQMYKMEVVTIASVMGIKHKKQAVYNVSYICHFTAHFGIVTLPNYLVLFLAKSHINRYYCMFCKLAKSQCHYKDISLALR